MLSFLFRRLAIEFQYAHDNNLKIFKLIQSKLLQLNWKLFQPNSDELKLMFNLVNNSKFRLERFITKIICSINWSNLFEISNHKDLPDISFNLAYLLVKTSFKKSDLKIDDYPLHLIKIDDLKILSKLIEEKVQFEEYLINQNESSEMMFLILERSCFVNLNQKNILNNTLDNLIKEEDKLEFEFELQKRRLLYSKTYCEILLNSVRNNSSIYKKYLSELKMFFADFLYRTKIFEKGNRLM